MVPRVALSLPGARRHPGDARGRSAAADGRRVGLKPPTRAMPQLDFKVVIPARLDSTRLPRKVLREIHGRPLLQYVWQAARDSGAQEVIVAVDHEEIRAVCAGFGADVRM